ncbi:uncharacterized protein Dana_GF24558 [Drosophila ananassae]|uniref:MADF domain-containing protein n=1 Tax=Drosophila ananassae TaxID=7217 RepID=B3M3Y9_DROAN|nr:AF4/FMR2 family member lilli [Drosophila ananassae]EDV39323.1 uncharacterized protein Dana_GF24558 [Drosophila ananassae]
MSSSAAAAQFKLDANSNAIALIASDVASVASLPLPLPLPTSSPPTAATPADRIEWSRATILSFIEDYRRQRVLWDPNTKGYHIKQTKYEALKLLSSKYGTEIRSIRSKIKSLRSSFHREHGKVLSGRNRGVHYQPMWFAYEAIRFILDGERDQVTPDRDNDQETEPDEKLALMHSLDLEQLKVDSSGQHKVEQQHEELAARFAATVAAVAAAAAAANARDREREREADTADTDRDMDMEAGDLEEAPGAGTLPESSSAAVTRSSSDLDGENYCNISAEDVKTEIIEHESDLGMLERRTCTPSPINYYKPTDLTYNHRKRKALPMDEGSGGGAAGGGGMEHVVGALTLTPIKAGGIPAVGGSTGQQMNHSQLAFQALQQHFNHSHSHSLSISHCNGGQGQGQNHHSNHTHNHNHNHQHQHQQPLQLQQQQQQQQHSSNMAQKRDRDRDLSTSTTSGTTNNNNNNNNTTTNNNSSNTTSPTSLDAIAVSSTCNSGTTPPKPLNGGGGLSANHVDEYGVFGEYVAITIRKLKTSKSKIVVKHLINNLLYEAELGKYDHGIPATKEPPQLYKMQ